MTPQQLLRFIHAWLWLCVLGALLALPPSYLISTHLPKVYEGKTRLIVTGPALEGVTDYNSVMAAEHLAHTYSEAMKIRPVIEAAIAAAGVDLAYGEVLPMMEVTPVRDTSLIQLTVRANDPELAARLANELATAFIKRMQTGRVSRFAATEDSLAKQVDESSAELAARTRDLERIRSEPPSPQRNDEIVQAEFDISQLQQSRASAVRNYEDVRLTSARNSSLVELLEPAYASLDPVAPRVLVNVVAASVFGVLIALAVGALVDYRLRTERRERLTRAFGQVAQAAPASGLTGQ